MLNSSIVISPLVLFSGKVNKAVRRTYHIFFANSSAASHWHPLRFYRKFVTQTNKNLPEDAKISLCNRRGEFQELGDAYMFKEALRVIYSRAQTSYHARIAFHRWIKFAEETRIPELRTMAKTLRDKIVGIISFWTFRHISNASMEGFNNKIRWLIKQAYGFRDSEYFKLKIYQLPEISSVKEL